MPELLFIRDITYYPGEGDRGEHRDRKFAFSELLHRRGSDFKIYHNKWVEQGEELFDLEKDSPLLQAIVKRLMADSSGVEWLSVTVYEIVICYSQAIATGYLMDLIIAAAHDAGYEVQQGCKSAPASDEVQLDMYVPRRQADEMLELLRGFKKFLEKDQRPPKRKRLRLLSKR